MASLERLPTPTPFVFGGSFSEYLRGSSKFRRFSTLTSFGNAVCSLNDSADTISEVDVLKLYAQARQQGVGTVSHIETPEGSMNIVNLVDVARFIAKSTGLGITGNQDEEAEDDVGEDEDLGCSEIEFLPKDELANPAPVVYSGTFQDYKKGASKFTRFNTLAHLAQGHQVVAVKSPPLPLEQMLLSAASMIVDDSSCEEAGAATSASEVIIHGPLSQAHAPCQLLALATPPSMQKKGCIYTTLSDAIVRSMIGLTVARAKATANMAVVKGVPKSIDGDVAMPLALGTPSLRGSRAHRSRFDEEALHSVDSKGFALSSKVNFEHPLKDDGSNWMFCGAAPASSVPFVAHRRRSLCQTGSSWGGGGSLLEPITKGKISLDEPVKLTLSNLDSPWMSLAS